MSFIGDLIYFGAIYFHDKYKTLSRIVIGIAVFFGVLGLLAEKVTGLMMSLTVIAFLLCPFYAIWGIVAQVAYLPLKKQRQKYQSMFEGVKLVSFNGDYPLYLGDDENEYTKVLTFRTIIPLKDWLNKKELMQSYLNTEIIKICHAENDNNIIHVITVKKPLPTDIAWNDEIHPERNVLTIGKSYAGYAVIDLNKSPHTFIAGETGSGKSNILKCMIYQCIVKNHEVKLIDFKRGVSFAVFEQYMDIYSDYEPIKIVLENMVRE
jgi:DNA segregation ATPase FtsK/SpoIIIE and related proteins